MKIKVITKVVKCEGLKFKGYKYYITVSDGVRSLSFLSEGEKYIELYPATYWSNAAECSKGDCVHINKNSIYLGWGDKSKQFDIFAEAYDFYIACLFLPLVWSKAKNGGELVRVLEVDDYAMDKHERYNYRFRRTPGSYDIYDLTGIEYTTK